MATISETEARERLTKALALLSPLAACASVAHAMPAASPDDAYLWCTSAGDRYHPPIGISVGDAMRAAEFLDSLERPSAPAPERGLSDAPVGPNLTLMTNVADTSNVCGDFLRWLLDTHHLLLAEYIGSSLRLTQRPATDLAVNRWLAEYFHIDYDEMERERLALLEWVRRAQPEGAHAPRPE